MSGEVVVCHYSSTMVQWALDVIALPYLISGMLTVIGAIFGVFTLACYGAFLFFWNTILTAIQAGLNEPYPDPMCPGHVMPGPPCIVAFYVSSVATWVICYYLLKWKRPGAMYVPFMIAFFFLPPLILIWFGYFGFWDVFVMVVTGVVTTLIFFWFMLGYILPDLEYIIGNSVIRWFEYGDIIYMTKKQREAEQRDLLVTTLLRRREQLRKEREDRAVRVILPEWTNA